MTTDPEMLRNIARGALHRAGRRGRGRTDRRRHAVQALIAVRPNLSPVVALRLVRGVEGAARCPPLAQTA